jgi:hypothetical protein
MSLHWPLTLFDEAKPRSGAAAMTLKNSWNSFFPNAEKGLRWEFNVETLSDPLHTYTRS